MLHPIAVLEPALAHGQFDRDRFRALDLGYEVASFVDLGQEVTVERSFAAPRDLPPRLAESVLWHPFQLWLFGWLARILDVGVTLDTALAGPDACARAVGQRVAHVPQSLVDLARSDRHAAFLRVLALLLAAEPLVHTMIDPTVRLHPHVDGGGYAQSLPGYFSWLEDQDTPRLLAATGLSAEQAVEWHNELAVSAQLVDPLETWRILLRHADRGKRERLRGGALRAHSLYDAAEVLRRYLERFHGRQLVEEDDARHGPRGPRVKRRLYGAARTGDYDRAVFRRIVREFDLDPQARTTWFLEGATERGFVERLAAREHIDLALAGVEIMELEGLGGLASTRLRSLLERLRREEVFTYVTIDRDTGTKHPALLRTYASDGLLSAGYRIWTPDFEGANFTLDELAAAATKVAHDGGTPLTITAQQLEREMARGRHPAGGVIVRLWRTGKFYGGKGATWGRALADWALDHPRPEQTAEAGGARPIVDLFSHLLAGQWSHYRATAAGNEVDATGNLVRKRRGPGGG